LAAASTLADSRLGGLSHERIRPAARSLALRRGVSQSRKLSRCSIVPETRTSSSTSSSIMERTSRSIRSFQAFFRERKPPTLIVWGKNDKIFPADGATPYLRDLPEAELHLLDTGHFALEDKADVMIPLIRDFLSRKLVSR
jgi:pimeloyl-ACP methyl ester carboxylesterase